eukprot:988378-Pyramimonas_sp.AAC.1
MWERVQYDEGADGTSEPDAQNARAAFNGVDYKCAPMAPSSVCVAGEFREACLDNVTIESDAMPDQSHF